MKIINMDPNFLPLGKGEEFESFTFPSGFEPHYKLDPLEFMNQEVVITVRFKDAGDMFKLALLKDALDRSFPKSVSLYMPFVPFGRQDRVMVSGEPFSLVVFARFINSLKFMSVTIIDPHSDVTPALFDRVVVKDNHVIVEKALYQHYSGELPEEVCIVSPDAGAEKKILKVAQHLSMAYPKTSFKVVKCSKERNVVTGALIKADCPIQNFEHLPELFIVDDICDGGGTFSMTGKMLQARGANGVNLIVTFGIFSKRLTLEYIDTIYTTDAVKDFEAVPDKFNVLSITK